MAINWFYVIYQMDHERNQFYKMGEDGSLNEKEKLLFDWLNSN